MEARVFPVQVRQIPILPGLGSEEVFRSPEVKRSGLQDHGYQEEGFVMKARSIRALAGTVVLLVLVSVSSCQVSPKSSGALGARARKAGDVLPLVIGRISAPADHFYSSNQKVSIQPSFDPGMVNLKAVSSYKLWLQDPVVGTWSEVSASEALPISYETGGEGNYGFRISVVMEGDREFLSPQGGESPQIWFCVDKTPPVVKWTGAGKTFFFSGKSRLSLSLNVSEQQLGKSPLEVEWSMDGGQKWTPLTTRVAKNGEQTFPWFFPQGVETQVQVRAMVTDLTGLTGTDTLILQSENGAVVSSLDSPTLSLPEETPEPVVAEVLPPDEESVPEPEPEVVVELPPAIQFISPEAECILAGDEIEIAWEIREEPADQVLDPGREVVLEFYSPASDEWETIGDTTVGAGQMSWVAPELTLVDCRLRLVVTTAAAAEDGGEAEVLEFDSNPFGVDASAPRVACEQLPAVVGGLFSLEVELVDEGCSAPEDVQAFIRAEGEEFWNALDSSRVQLEAAGEKFTVSLELGEEKEKKYDLYLVATDSLGNVAAAPGVASESIGSFQLDNTPPLVAIGEPGTDWVAGLPAVLRVQFDPSDCAGPLVIEGRAGNEDGEWAELARLDDLALAEDGVNFNVPADISELEVRVLARDALGNPGYGILSPRRLKSPVRLDTMTRGGVFQAFDKQKIAWTLQPAVLADTKDLLVRIEYRVGDSGAWELLQEGAPEAQVQSGEWEWVLPDAAEDELTLRVGLYRGQALLGEDVSGSFKIEGFAKTEAGVLRESLIALDSAQEKESDWRKRSDEAAPTEELTSLAKAAEADYRKALSLDAKNAEASFRLSMLLNDMNPETHSDEVLQLLEATIAQEPENISAQLNLGAVLIQRNELDRAKTVTEKVLEQEDSGQARFNLALALLFKGEGEAARSQFELALSKGGNVPEGLAWFYIAWSHADEGNMEVARNLYSEKKTVIPDDFKSIIEEKLR